MNDCGAHLLLRARRRRCGHGRMTKLRSTKHYTEDWHERLPDLELLFKYELSACTKEEVVRLCQALIDSGHLHQFNHPIRRTVFDLAVEGMVVGIDVPPGYRELNGDPDRETHLNVMVH